MKYFFFALLLSFNVFASDELIAHLKQKDANYTSLKEHYATLATHVKAKDAEKFCACVKKSRKALDQIFADDQELMKALRSFENEDYTDYAKQIEDNIYSPLFSYTAYTDMCQRARHESIFNLTISLQFHAVNVDYLKLSNLLFWQTVSN